MHSSRMRTARLLAVSPSIHCSGGVSQHAMRQTPPVDRMTDTCKNNLRKLLLWAVIICIVDLYRPQRKLREDNVFTPVCDSTTPHASQHPLPTPNPEADTFTPTPLETATEAGGTHPIGMHSCTELLITVIHEANIERRSIHYCKQIVG